ncbi:MAG TPA: methionyl-tRNA formyltransferase [Tepidisphaeraceae bacterium]|nr:methionyl-tRNA formyltransferase [Tepidisphaeraceae bacterium]
MSRSLLRIIFAGSGEFGLPTLGALSDAGHELVQIISQPDRPAGRGRELTPTPVSKFALERDLPLLRTQNINAQPPPPADLLVVIAFGQKIAPHVVSHARFGGINLHASLLPKYRGAAPINWAIIRGETTTGNSVIRLADRMDAGAILGQSELCIGDTETAGQLHDRLSQDGAPLMLRVIEELATGTANERAQDESLATIAPKLSREASRLDFTRPAGELANQIRGLSPWPGCRVRLLSQDGSEVVRLTLVSCTAAPADVSGEAPGSLADDGGIVAGDGLLHVLLLKPEGKRPMTVKDFRNARPWTAGMRIESVA